MKVIIIIIHTKVWKVSLEWRILQHTRELKSSTSSVDLCVPTKLAQITVLEASKMKQKCSMTDGNGVHTDGATVKNVKIYRSLSSALPCK